MQMQELMSGGTNKQGRAAGCEGPAFTCYFAFLSAACQRLEYARRFRSCCDV